MSGRIAGVVLLQSAVASDSLVTIGVPRVSHYSCIYAWNRLWLMNCVVFVSCIVFSSCILCLAAVFLRGAAGGLHKGHFVSIFSYLALIFCCFSLNSY